MPCPVEGDVSGVFADLNPAFQWTYGLTKRMYQHMSLRSQYADNVGTSY